MRQRFLIAVLLVASVILITLVIRPKRESTIPTTSSTVESVSSDVTNQDEAGVSSEVVSKPAPSKKEPANEPVIVSTDDALIKLHEFSMQDDPKSLAQILVYLTNSSPEIREAALEATMQFGSRDAIPVLKEIAARTDDPREKMKILEAIEFIELPSFSEVRKPRQKN